MAPSWLSVPGLFAAIFENAGTGSYLLRYGRCCNRMRLGWKSWLSRGESSLLPLSDRLTRLSH